MVAKFPNVVVVIIIHISNSKVAQFCRKITHLATLLLAVALISAWLSKGEEIMHRTDHC